MYVMIDKPITVENFVFDMINYAIVFFLPFPSPLKVTGACDQGASRQKRGLSPFPPHFFA